MPAEKIDAVATVYARALFELADAAGGRAKLEEIADELEQIVELKRGDRRFAEFMTSPIVDRDARDRALRRIFDGRITDLLLRFLIVLNRKGRLDRIDSVQRAFDARLQEAFGRVEVDVFTAAPIAEESLADVRRLVQEAIGREPVLHRYVDPAMLGGIRLRIGDRLVDASVVGRLNRMRDQVLARGAGAIRQRIDRIIEDRRA